MAAKLDKDKCVGCMVCIDSCPVACIKADGDKVLIIEGDCVDCGVCLSACPVDALSM
jgi:NAD-dependent dihydropyrimidine dehydrogenase PreA subunit